MFYKLFGTRHVVVLFLFCFVLKTKEMMAHEPLFGVPLETVMRRPGESKVPTFVKHAIAYLNEKGTCLLLTPRWII